MQCKTIELVLKIDGRVVTLSHHTEGRGMWHDTALLVASGMLQQQVKNLDEAMRQFVKEQDGPFWNDEERS